MKNFSFIDSHCHLDYLKSRPLNEILGEAKNLGLSKALTISVTPENFSAVIDLTKQYGFVYGTQGIHPHHADKFTNDVLERIESNSGLPKIVAVGEIGLDYYYDKSDRDKQRQAFRSQLELAAKLGRPVVIHTRNAEDDTKTILNDLHQRLPNSRGVLHSYTSSWDLASKALDWGFSLGFNGIMTFKNAQEVRDVFLKTPLDRILVETDAPFLAPVPHRGKENGPQWVPEIIRYMADLKKVAIEEMAEKLIQNTLQVFPGLGN